MKKLLVIDDDEVFAKVVSTSLATHGFTLATANSAFEATRLASEMQPDFILLDLKIANDSGLRLIPKLMAINGAAKIVVLTGYANIQTAIEAIKLGAIHYLSKPATITEIISAFDKSGGNPGLDIESETVPLNRLERSHIEAVLAKNKGNISSAARELKMHRRTLQRKLYKKA